MSALFQLLILLRVHLIEIRLSGLEMRIIPDRVAYPSETDNETRGRAPLDFMDSVELSSDQLLQLRLLSADARSGPEDIPCTSNLAYGIYSISHSFSILLLLKCLYELLECSLTENIDFLHQGDGVISGEKTEALKSCRIRGSQTLD